MTPEEYGDLVTGTKINAVDLTELFNEDWITIDETLPPDTIYTSGEVINVKEPSKYHYHSSGGLLDKSRYRCYNANCDESPQGQRF